MSREGFPGTDFLDRLSTFYQDQFQFWTDLRAQMNTTADKIRSDQPYALKDWLKDSLDVWDKSLSAGEALFTAPMQLAGDERTPVLSFQIEDLGKSQTAGPKTARVRPLEKTSVETGDLIGAGSKLEKKYLLARFVRRGLLEVQIAGVPMDTPKGQYIGVIFNSDTPIALVHLNIKEKTLAAAASTAASPPKKALAKKTPAKRAKKAPARKAKKAAPKKTNKKARSKTKAKSKA